MSKFFDWYDKAQIDQNNQDNIFPPNMQPVEAVDMLIEYLLGPDWYVVDPLAPKQVITQAVYDILFKYSKLFQQEVKRY